jgi:hypothetical protein
MVAMEDERPYAMNNEAPPMRCLRLAAAFRLEPVWQERVPPPTRFPSQRSLCSSSLYQPDPLLRTEGLKFEESYTVRLRICQGKNWMFYKIKQVLNKIETFRPLRMESANVIFILLAARIVYVGATAFGIEEVAWATG